MENKNEEFLELTEKYKKAMEEGNEEEFFDSLTKEELNILLMGRGMFSSTIMPEERNEKKATF